MGVNQIQAKNVELNKLKKNSYTNLDHEWT